MITDTDLRIARLALEKALSYGASHARIGMTYSRMDSVTKQFEKIDRVSHSLDKGLTLVLFVDGRYGTYSTNKLDPDSLDTFVQKSIEMTRLLRPDAFRSLPDEHRQCKNAITGDELDLYDSFIETVDSPLDLMPAIPEDMLSNKSIVSMESEFALSEWDSLLIDSKGLYCRHRESSFDYVVDLTIDAPDGGKYNGCVWDTNPFRAKLQDADIAHKALQKAMDQIGPKDVPSGKYTLVVDAEVVGKIVTPLLSALQGFSIQQGNSFLLDSLDRQVLSPGLTIIDSPFRQGESGSKLFDSEGVSTCECPIIENGIVRRYFISDYISRKTGMAPTNADAARPHLLPYISGELCRGAEASAKRMDTDAIVALCADGILVTDFNGGNSNPATGDFSFGISGWRFRDGVKVHPVNEMLITGNFLDLWNNLLVAGDNILPRMSKLIPTLAFANVDFSA